MYACLAIDVVSQLINTDTLQAQHQHRQQSQTRRDEEKRAAQSRTTPLALLAADEAAIAARKAAIRNFGAYWIRPPGISKTLQAMTEEAAELAEQEEMLRQEQGLRDLQAQQEVEEARRRAAEVGEAGGEVEEEERDLDDEIPDADAESAGDEEVTFNEESMMEGSRLEDNHDVEQREYAALEEAELTGAARDEEDLGIEPERNLDDSVPEAGSYQHTDTEVEDSTSDEDSSLPQDSFAGAASRQQASSARRPNTRSSNRSQQSQRLSASQARRRLPFEAADNGTFAEGSLQERMRAAVGDASLSRSPGSLNLSSSLLESSFVGSSPVVQRGARGRGGAHGRGRLS